MKDFTKGGWVKYPNDQYYFMTDISILANPDNDILFADSPEEVLSKIREKEEFDIDKHISRYSLAYNFYIMKNQNPQFITNVSIEECIKLVKIYKKIELNGQIQIDQYEQLWKHDIYIDAYEIIYSKQKAKRQQQKHNRSQLKKIPITQSIFSTAVKALNFEDSANKWVYQILRNYSHSSALPKLADDPYIFFLKLDCFNAIYGKNSHRKLKFMQIFIQLWKTTIPIKRDNIHPTLQLWLEQENHAPKYKSKKFTSKDIVKTSTYAKYKNYLGIKNYD